jgi:hypothetical protein
MWNLWGVGDRFVGVCSHHQGSDEETGGGISTVTERQRQQCEAFRQWVGQLQAIVSQQAGIAEFQAAFGQQPLLDELDEQAQAYLVEIRKQLRLLETDLMFLKAARRQETSQQRWQMMGDRLRLLGVYGDGLSE